MARALLASLDDRRHPGMRVQMVETRPALPLQPRTSTVGGARAPGARWPAARARSCAALGHGGNSPRLRWARSGGCEGSATCEAHGRRSSACIMRTGRSTVARVALRVTLSPHVEDRMRERQITVDHIRRVVAHHDVRLEEAHGKVKYTGTVDGRRLKVVIQEGTDPAIVLTAFWQDE